jgi:hypothetical protein|tara:strand:- start:3163 stop:4518 length:1356 start_codon:yes stop_codon:yes gene_type:complete
LTKARDLANLISGGFTEADIPNLSASKITSGTFADARLSQSSVQQYASTFDDNKIVNDISTLALRQASNENKAAYNTNSMYVDVFQDSTGITNLTNVLRNDSEYMSTGSTSSGTATSNVGGSDTNFGDSNTRWSADNTRDTYGTGNDLGYNGTSYNYNFLSSSDGSDYPHTPDSADALIVGNGKIWFDGVNNDVGSGTGNNADSEYYEIGLLDSYTGISNTALLTQNAGTFSGIIMAFSGQTRDVKVIKVSGGNTKTYLTTINGSELASASTVIQMARMNGRIYISFADVLKYTVSESDFNSTANLAMACAFGRTNAARQFNNVGYRANMTRITGLPYSETTFSSTGSFESNAITAPSSTSSMGAIITYQDQAGTNALNTDIVLKLSADNGSNYSTATLVAMPDFASGIKMAKVNDLTISNAGTSLKYKLEFANQASGSKEARIRGVSLQY